MTITTQPFLSDSNTPFSRTVVIMSSNRIEHQRKNVFTSPSPQLVKLAFSRSNAENIAKSNSAVYIGAHTTLKYVTTDENRVVPAVFDATGTKQISPSSKFGGLNIMVAAKCSRMFKNPQQIFEENVMTGQEKQTFYLDPIDESEDSVAGIDQLTDLFSGEPWSKAVSECPNHNIEKAFKKKNPSKEDLYKHALSMVDKGQVYFPTVTDAESGKTTPKFWNKIVMSNRKYSPNKQSGFDIDCVQTYFATNPDTGLKLTEFLGRDYQAWEGKTEEIECINAGYFL